MITYVQPEGTDSLHRWAVSLTHPHRRQRNSDLQAVVFIVSLQSVLTLHRRTNPTCYKNVANRH